MKSSKKSVPQQILEKVTNNAEIQDKVALRFLLVTNHLHQNPEIDSVTVEMVTKTKHRETGRKIPKKLTDESFKVLTDHNLVKIDDSNVIKISRSGISAAFTLQLKHNEHLLKKILPPHCQRKRVLDTSEIYFAGAN